MQPAVRQVVRGSRHETLEPRAMQVLVALAESPGTIVSHDDLIERCWDGRIVSDNAIHRAISRVREVVRTLGDGELAVETISKVGYRIVLRPAAEGGGTAARPKRHARRLALAGAAFLLLGGALLAWGSRPVAASVTVIQVDARGTQPLTGELALDIERFLRLAGSKAALELREGDGGDLRIVVTSRRGAVNEVVDLSMTGPSGDLLWSSSLQVPVANTGLLRSRAAGAVGGALFCALEAGPPRSTVSGKALRLYIAGCVRAREEQDEIAARMLKQAAAEAPDLAVAWARLAQVEAMLGYALGGRGSFSDTPHKQELRAAARQHLLRARRLDPGIGLTWATAALLVDPAHWEKVLELRQRGLAIAPDSAHLHDAMAVSLAAIGRVSDAAASARRAVELDPVAPEHRETLIRALLSAGIVEEARRELELAEAMSPRSPQIRGARYAYDLRYGNAAALLKSIERGEVEAYGSAEANGPNMLLLRARADPTPANVDALLESTGRVWRRHPYMPQMHLPALGQFGKIDQAFAVLEDPQALAGMRTSTDILFRPPLRPLRSDRRFFTVAQRLGLLEYWSANNRWPDFCQSIPLDCRAEADRLLKATGA
ncbi:MAG: winged helix-turn-helix domain-containing protein [Allosphingosinicella sp.]|uniref:winged helix-turn-helix domain-containing protein n=1 Tax=Allosphingosinicella sp. TaxID=2823234 RepID=UPI0039533E54